MEGNARSASEAGGPGFLAAPGLQLLIFGGKGGVGKTTCATAAALRLAAGSPHSFLLVSTDPAHSLADSLAGLVPPRNLKVLELDPQEYLLDFKKKHSAKLREIASRGTFLDDEEINRFLDLSLPGLDELMAFLEISAWVEKRVYDCIVVDTAPSGHTLRLLTMPEFLRKWLAMLETLLAKHRYMKWAYARSRERDELDYFLDELSASVKQMEGVLQDSARCSFVPVMLAEAMSLRETVSIVNEADRLLLPIGEIIVNKLLPESDCPVCSEEHGRQGRELRDLFCHTTLVRFALSGNPTARRGSPRPGRLAVLLGRSQTNPRTARGDAGLEAVPSVEVDAGFSSPAAVTTLGTGRRRRRRRPRSPAPPPCTWPNVPRTGKCCWFPVGFRPLPSPVAWNSPWALYGWHDAWSHGRRGGRTPRRNSRH